MEFLKPIAVLKFHLRFEQLWSALGFSSKLQRWAQFPGVFNLSSPALAPKSWVSWQSRALGRLCPVWCCVTSRVYPACHLLLWIAPCSGVRCYICCWNNRPWHYMSFVDFISCIFNFLYDIIIQHIYLWHDIPVDLCRFHPLLTSLAGIE